MKMSGMGSRYVIYIIIIILTTEGLKRSKRICEVYEEVFSSHCNLLKRFYTEQKKTGIILVV